MNGDATLGIEISDPVRVVPQGWSVKEHEREHAPGIVDGVKKFVWSYDVTVAPYAIVANGVASETKIIEQSGV